MLLLLLACSTRPATPAGSDKSTDSAEDTALVDPCAMAAPDDPCCRPPAETLWVCSEDLPQDLAQVGTFALDPSGRGDRSYTFTPADGVPVAVDFYGGDDALALIPDLPALGTLTVTNSGGCGADGEGSDIGGTFSILHEDGAIAFIVGATNIATAGPLTVGWDETNDTCPARPDTGCFSAVRNHSVNFLGGGGFLTLYQDDQGTLEGNTISLRMAMRPASDSHCDDVGGNMANWVITGPT